MVIPVKRKKTIVFLIASLILTVLFLSPWLFRDFVGIEHDTYFHLSRIEAFAEAFFHGDLIPRIYPYENFGYGYASPLFYSDFFLLIPSTLYHFGLPLSSSYVLMMFLTVFAGNYAMMHACEKMTEDLPVSILCAFAYCFANYHVTDVFVRSAVGESMALVFLPVLLEGLYVLFERGETSGWKAMFIGLTGLLLCHNLSFLLGAVLTALYFLLYLRRLTRKTIIAFFAAGILAFLCTVFFSLPMIEQLGSQKFYLNWYTQGNDLASYAVPLWKYFVNSTVFGYGSSDLPRDMQMTVNVGIFLSLAPLTVFFTNPKKHSFFTILSLIVGYLCFILPWDIFPWEKMSVFSILQFPWRLFAMAMPLLTIAAASGLSALFKGKPVPIILILLLVCGEGMYHVLPAFERTFGIDSHTTYSFLINGGLTDPCYSASYVRIQLAGGEYLPQNSPDFRDLDPVIRTGEGIPAGIGYDKNRTSLTFHVSEVPEDGELLMPLTWYLGYSVSGKNGAMAELSPSDEALVSLRIKEPGTYTVRYSGTMLQHSTAVISLFAWILVIFLFFRREEITSLPFPLKKDAEETGPPGE